MAALWNYSRLVMVAALAGAIVVIIEQHAELRALQASLHAREQQLGYDASSRKAAAAKLGAAEAKIKDLNAALAALVSAAGDKAASDTGEARKGTPLSEVTQAWLAHASDPDVVGRLQAHARRQILARYSGLIARLGLNEAASEQLLNLLVEKKLAPTDVAVSSLEATGGAGVDGQTLSTSVVAVRATIDSQIQALLGPAGYGAYKAYEVQAGQAGVVADVQAALAATATPLTEQQAAMLQQILEANNIGHVSEKVIGQSQTFLSPEQLAVLQNLQLRESKGSLSHVPQ